MLLIKCYINCYKFKKKVKYFAHRKIKILSIFSVERIITDIYLPAGVPVLDLRQIPLTIDNERVP